MERPRHDASARRGFENPIGLEEGRALRYDLRIRFEQQRPHVSVIQLRRRMRERRARLGHLHGLLASLGHSLA